MLDETQSGFRKGRSCPDCYFTLCQIIEKHREFNLLILIAFLDYEKAFHKVIRTIFWKVMIDKVFPQDFINVAQTLCLDTRIIYIMEKDT
jgi:hypothetical protein